MKEHKERGTLPEMKSVKKTNYHWWVVGIIVVLASFYLIYKQMERNTAPIDQPLNAGNTLLPYSIEQEQTISTAQDDVTLLMLKKYAGQRVTRNRKSDAMKWCGYRMKQISWWSPTYSYFRGQRHLIKIGKAKKQVVIEFSNNWRNRPRKK